MVKNHPLWSPHALVLLALVLAMSGTGLQRQALPVLFPLYGLAFAVLIHGLHRAPDRLGDPRVLLVWAVAFRLALFPILPDLSDDAFRYIWDGWLTYQGLNPYAATPADPALAHLHGEVLFREMNSPEFYSVYPPLAQLLFLPAGAAYAWVGWPGAFFVWKGTILFMEVGGAALLLQALRNLGRPLAPFALYAWNPLVLVTVAGNAHTEGAMILGVGLAVWGLTAARPWTAWVGLGVAGMVKAIPFAWSLLLARGSAVLWGWRRTATALGILAVAALGLTAFFWSPGMVDRVGSSVNLYVRYFEFNAGLYFLLKEGIVHWVGTDPTEVLGPALRWAFLLWLAGVSLLHPARDPRTLLRGFLLVVSGYLILATTVHPWYLLWVLPLLPFTSLLRAPWTWVSFASFATYFIYLDVPDPHTLHLRLTAVVWGGFLVLALREAGPAGYQWLLRWAGRRKARHLAPHLPEGTVLDLGAGEGYVAEALARRGYRVLCADVAPMRKAHVPFLLYDGTTLPFPTRSVDATVLSLVLHHARDPRSVLREALRVSRKRVVVTESTYRTPWGLRVLTFLDRFVNRVRGEGALRGMEEQLHFRRVEEWEELFREEGARMVRRRWLNRTGHRYILFELEPRGGPGPRADSAPGRGLRREDQPLGEER